MPRTISTPSRLVKPFVKAIDLFMEANAIDSKKAQAQILGVRDSTLRDWRTGKRVPTAETIARVSGDLAAVERFLSTIVLPELAD